MARATRSPRRTTSRQPAKISHAEAGPRVVVVEDDPDILNIVALLLKADGFRVSLTSFSEEAIAALQAEPVQLLITDLRLADGDGIDVIRHAAHITPRRPAIILLTAGHAQEEISVSTFLASVNAIVVQKPFDIDYLLELARRLTGWTGIS